MARTMRPLRLLALVTPVLVLLPIAIGCEDTGSSSGATFNPEAGPGFEAGPTPIPEGGLPAEAGADVVVPPVVKGITVTVLDGATPAPNVRVILNDAAGAVIGDLKTDATGKVTAATAPSMVTVFSEFRSKGTYPYPQTFLGVVDGDNLRVNLADDRPESTNVGQFNVSLGTGFTNATNYEVTVGRNCSNSTNTLGAVVVDLSSDCFAPQAAVLASAGDQVGILAYGFLKNVAKPAAVGVPQNVGPLTFAAKGATLVTQANRPPNSNPSAELLAIANGAGFYLPSTGDLVEVGLTFPTATGFADAYQVTGRITVSGATTNQKTLIRREATTAPASATLAIDFANVLPSISNATLTNATTARPTVTVAPAAPLSTADGMIVRVSFQNFSWRFIAPATTTTFQVPAVPANAGTFLPSGSSTVDEIIVADSTLIPSYTEIKKLSIGPNVSALLDSSIPLPATGTVRLLFWTNTD